LRGKTVALAFFETSTRTRISFATAASRLGADTMNLQAEASSFEKRRNAAGHCVQLERDEARLPGDAARGVRRAGLRLRGISTFL